MKNNMIIYVSKDGNIKVDVNIQNETIWMSQDMMANLYDTTKQNISYHLNNIFKEKELDKDSVVKNFLTTASDGKNYNVLHYNLDAIIAVGYRINSKKATEFRMWATKILKEYIVKGFSLNDEKLKNNGENPYFEELLARIRDIRSSEKIFWHIHHSHGRKGCSVSSRIFRRLQFRQPSDQFRLRQGWHVVI